MLFAFIFIGYFMRSKKLLGDKAPSVLSTLGTYVFYPAYLICNLSQNFTVATLKSNAGLFLFGLGLVVVELAVAFVFSLLFKKSDVPRNTLIYIFAFANYGYFGYPVIEGVFGGGLLSKTIVVMLTSSVAISSLGYFLLVGKSKGALKVLLSPTIIALVIGIAIGLSGFTLPKPINDILSGASGCMSPVSMLLIGVVLGKFSLSELFRSPKAYLVTLMRLIAIPTLFALLLFALRLKDLYFAIPLIVTAMPIGANTVMFTESAGYDSSESARICFISYLFGIVTIPLFFALAGMMM